jgi:RNA polymerase sigma factor (sigma-70 family)
MHGFTSFVRHREMLLRFGITWLLCTVVISLVSSFHRIKPCGEVGSQLKSVRPVQFFSPATTTSLHAREYSYDSDIKGIVEETSMKHTLLTFDKEVALATDYQKARYLMLIDKQLSDVLGRKATDEEISEKSGFPKELIEAHLDKGFLAKRVLVKSNMRLVLHIAGFYKNRGLGLADLIQEGFSGLQKAIDKYDPKKGFRFSTYASWWIKQAIARAVAEKSRLVRLPVHIHDMVISLGRIEEAFFTVHCRYPTNTELAHHMAISTSKVMLLKKCSQDVKSADDASSSTGTAAEPDSGEKSATAAAAAPLPDEEQELIEVDAHSTMRAVHQLSRYELNERERNVLEMRYGLRNGRVMTLEEVGKELNVTRERVRQIESRSMMKMKEQDSITPRHRMSFGSQHLTLTVTAGGAVETRQTRRRRSDMILKEELSLASAVPIEMSVFC